MKFIAQWHNNVPMNQKDRPGTTSFRRIHVLPPSCPSQKEMDLIVVNPNPPRQLESSHHDMYFKYGVAFMKERKIHTSQEGLSASQRLMNSTTYTLKPHHRSRSDLFAARHQSKLESLGAHIEAVPKSYFPKKSLNFDAEKADKIHRRNIIEKNLVDIEVTAPSELRPSAPTMRYVGRPAVTTRTSLFRKRRVEEQAKGRIILGRVRPTSTTHHTVSSVGLPGSLHVAPHKPPRRGRNPGKYHGLVRYGKLQL